MLNPASLFSRQATTTARNAVLPTECDLIVRGIGARKPMSDPVKLLQNAIAMIRKDVPELADIPVVVKPTGLLPPTFISTPDCFRKPPRMM